MKTSPIGRWCAVLTAVFLIGFSSSTWAATYTWSGGYTTGAWAQASNWGGSGYPGSGTTYADQAYINSNRSLGRVASRQKIRMAVEGALGMLRGPRCRVRRRSGGSTRGILFVSVVGGG